MFGMSKGKERLRSRYDVTIGIEEAINFQPKTLDERDAQERAVKSLRQERKEWDAV